MNGIEILVTLIVVGMIYDFIYIICNPSVTRHHTRGYIKRPPKSMR